MVGDEPLSPGRLEAFSDGVIAIILTIMVLELKSPGKPDPHALLHEWPLFISYIISFFYVACMDQPPPPFPSGEAGGPAHPVGEHRVAVFHALEPFFTEWMESTRLGPFPTAVYAATMLVAGVAFSVLDRVIGRQGIGGAELVLLQRASNAEESDRDCDLRGCDSRGVLPSRHSPWR